jgi:hypothetical protein
MGILTRSLHIYLYLHLALMLLFSSESVREFTRPYTLTVMTDIKQLLKEFERFAYGQSLRTAFTDLLDWTLLPFKKFDSSDEQLLAFNTFRDHPNVEQLTSMLTLIGYLSEGYADPIGELYVQAISNGHNGQYFTPEPICDMMSIMSVGEQSQNGKTVADCACGSGRMLLAAAKINRHMKFYGADLDITCCKMALLNMLLNSLIGEIAHMNSLSNELYKGFQVCTALVEGQHIPYYVEFTDAASSYICLHDLKGTAVKSAFRTAFEPVKAASPINGIQGSLF